MQLPMALYCENQATIHTAFILVFILVFHEQTKHIERDGHLVREWVEIGVIATPYVSIKPKLLICYECVV